MSEQARDKTTIHEQAAAGVEAVELSARTSGEASGDAGDAGASLWGDAWKELRRNPWFILAGVLMLVFILMAIVPGLFTRVDPRACNLSDALQTPSGEHWFGTDVQGCDYYARVVYGARASMAVGMLVTIGAVVIAIVLGLVAGFYGGFIDAIISRAVDVVFALPFLLGAIVFLNVIENRGLMEVALVLIVFGWPTMTRLMRSSVISVKANEYVAAARGLGASDLTIMRRHILSNALAPLVVYATIYVGIIIGAEATLTFLGVGLQLPSISWGLQLSGAQTRIMTHPHLILFPAVFVGLAVFSFMMMGDALRDALDPKRR
ncbi:ABC transporter permease [Ornithinimicrobium sufpigmenti]|uniref:ABC transporter permease n=1 Tax=Ornithinimicrobium sufpigmenti TaxID=2508882 RepID=UPI0010366D0B|nr:MULTISPECIES: ABC transporter permease [unclassified Ornithinimicrobium]